MEQDSFTSPLEDTSDLDPIIANVSEIDNVDSDILDEPTDSELRENFLRLIKKFMMRMIILVLLGVGIYYSYQYFLRNGIPFIAQKSKISNPEAIVNSPVTTSSIANDFSSLDETQSDEKVLPVRNNASDVASEVKTNSAIAPMLTSVIFQNLVSASGFTKKNILSTQKFIDFLDLSTLVVTPVTKLELQKSGRTFVIFYELQLGVHTFFEMRTLIEQYLVANGQKVEQAIFGADSFYFLWGEHSTTVFQYGESLIGVHYALVDFPSVKVFLSKLLNQN